MRELSAILGVLGVVSAPAFGSHASYCVAFGCRNKHGKCDNGFHRFPKDKSRRERPVAAVRREGWEATDYTRICGAHFVTGRFEVQLFF